jgi:ATP-dependent helicase/nuclease subunit B
MDEEDMEKISEYTNKWIKQAARNIYKGDIRALSYKYSSEEGCTYCPYAGVCGIEPKTRDDMVRKLDSIGDANDRITTITVSVEEGNVYEID